MKQQEGYVDDVVKGFMTWSIIWGSVSVLLGVFISLQLAYPDLNFPPISPTDGCARFIPTPVSSAGDSAASWLFTSTSPNA